MLGAAAVVVLLLPWPAPLSLPGLLTLGGVAAAVWAVRAPGSLAPLALLATGVVTWLAAVPDPGLLRILGFTGAAYVVHSAAALAAAVPVAAPVGAGVLRRWAVRTMLALGLGWGVLAMTAVLAGQPGSTPLVVVGMLAAVMLVALPAVVLRWGASVRSTV